MYPLLFCSILALIIIIERIIFFSRLSEWADEELRLFKLYIGKGKWDEVRVMATKWRSPVGRVVGVAVKQHDLEPDGLEAAMQLAGEMETQRLQRGLGVLDTIVTASPLLGLLGTVTGIIKSFTALSVTGTQAPQLSLGIAEALYTTAVGLSIAIPALFFLNWFYGIAEKQAQKLTGGSREILRIIRQG
ncbi:MAG: MotA/TolQ/ExbB proton channel family protein [Bacillota bacterium]|jgi:biopolymer transport protein ExbB